MGKTRDLTPRKSAEIKALITTGNYSNREVSRRLFVSESSVRRIKKKIELGQELIPQRKKNCGRKQIFTPRSERCLKKICLEDRFASTKDIKSKLESNNIHASERTVRRKLSDLQFKAYRPARKPKLTDAMKVKRLKWARDLKDKDLDFWKSVSICVNALGLCFSLSESNVSMFYTCLYTASSFFSRFASVTREHLKYWRRNLSMFEGTQGKNIILTALYRL